MKAIIPVAGFGTRMRPHTLTHPKVLLPVADKPMIAHIVEKLIDDGVDELIFVVGHLGEQVQEFIRTQYQVPSRFIPQTEFLGLGHAIYTAGDYLQDEPLIIVLGDTIYDVDLKPVLDSPYSTLGVKKVADPRRFGVAVLDENGFITRLVEKPKEFVSDLALVGLYFFRSGARLKSALEELIQKNIRTNNEFQLTDALQLMIEHGEKLSTFPVEGWYDCGKPETLLETNGILLRRDFSRASYSFPNTVIIPPVYIHPEAKVENAVIGPNVTVWEGSEIRDSRIRDSILMKHCQVEGAVLEYSILGDHTRVERKWEQLNMGDYSQESR
jgi:glucose-1-phosphate thymidylyltransferase